MSTRKPARAASFYRDALLGVKTEDGTHAPGLRSLAYGFDAANGYDLRDIDNWSRARKRRVVDYFERVKNLEAQQKRIVYPRNADTLKKLQGAFHGDVPSKGLRVAFVPDFTPPAKPGAKPKRPKLRILKSGAIRIDRGSFVSIREYFDPIALASDPDGELRRVLGLHPDAKLMFIQTGQYDSIGGEVDPDVVITKVKKWMRKYDGMTMPKGKDPRKYNPEQHAWWNWLTSVNFYIYPGRTDPAKLQTEILKGRENAKRDRDARIKAIRKNERKAKSTNGKKSPRNRGNRR